MKPKIKRLLIAIGSLLLGTNTFAYDFVVDRIYYNIISSTDKTVEVTYRGSDYNSYIEYSGEIIIPKTVTFSGTTYSVTSIGKSAFEDCSGLKSVTIGNSVTSIGEWAFSDCTGLTSVTIPNSVTSIGGSAFCRCSGLTEVSIGNSVTSIGDDAFYKCSGLTSVTIPNSVTEIGGYAFSGCIGLTEVNITDLSAWCKINFEITSSNPLYYAGHLKLNGTEITNLIIPDGITEIKNCTFSNCIGLTSVVIPNSVTSIGIYAFRGCSGLSFVTIPNSVTEIGSYAFEGCSGLTSVTIGNSVTSIGGYAFRDCSGLTEVNITDLSAWYKIDFGNSFSNPLYYAHHLKLNGKVITDLVIPDGITEIKKYAFSGCSDLTSVTIPNSVTSIGNVAFGYCSGLNELIITDGTENLSLGCNVSSKGLFSDCPLVKLYLGRNLSYDTGSYYGYSPFYNKTTLKEVTIGNSVTEIGGYAFCGCSGLTSITIPSSVSSIGDEAFRDCSGLTSVTIGSGVLSIGTSAFQDLDIKKVIWLTNTPPEGYKNLSSSVHYVSNNLYTGLSNVTIYPYLSSMFEVDGIKYVPVSPSERTCDAIDCTYDPTISNFNIGNTVSFKGIEMNIKAVKPYTFYKNTNIAKATIDPEFNGSIGDYAFAYCNKIDEIILHDGVTSLGSSAFEGCSSLASVKIGSGISAIKEKTFYGCSSLPSITIPANVTSIGNNVFGNCSSLDELTITDRETELSLGSNSSSPLFSDCPLKSVYIGGNITYPTSSGKGYSPFYRNTSLETVVITDKETEISENEFYGCTALKSVSMGDGVETIGNWAFSGCSSLDFFSFGSGMKTIGTEAFSDCTTMTKLYSKATVPPTCGTQALDDINKWNCELYVPQASIADYQAADQWKEFFFIKDIESGVEEVFVDGEDYSNAPIEIYNLSGLKVGDSTENLAPGVYIKRQGRKVEKIAIQ